MQLRAHPPRSPIYILVFALLLTHRLHLSRALHLENAHNLLLQHDGVPERMFDAPFDCARHL